jgi:alpha-ketoglutarate-dependent taurine dioxygenase
MSDLLTRQEMQPVHVLPPVVDAGPEWAALAPGGLTVGDDAFISAAGHACRLLPAHVHDALVDFADAGDPSGALLIRNAPVGTVPATPSSPRDRIGKDGQSEFSLLTVARRLGQPVGYLPEHGGDLVQNIVPTRAAAARQTSTSSRVELMFHTEAAFHPHRPRFLLLLCLRGDPAAATTLASIREVLPLLPARVVEVLFSRRFRIGVDESYLEGRPSPLSEPRAVLTGRRDRPSMVFDVDLMIGTDDEAERALRVLGEAVAACHTSVVLEPGDLLVVDNDAAVHGRSPFEPRFDGTDRWLQRTFVVADLAPSAGERTGRVITTRFG